MQRRSLTEEYMYRYRLLCIVVEASIASKAIRPPDKLQIHIAGGTRLMAVCKSSKCDKMQMGLSK
jgi:hypothetical protein